MINIRVVLNDAPVIWNRIRETVNAINAETCPASSSEMPDRLSIDRRQSFVDIVLGGEIIETVVIDEVGKIQVLANGEWANPIAVASFDGHRMQPYANLDLLLQQISQRIRTSHEEVCDLLFVAELAARPYFRLKD
ncbi:MAG: hypothetical protein ABR907_01335 [Terracidiphilus sp.]|jgi:hypothetical protein